MRSIRKLFLTAALAAVALMSAAGLASGNRLSVSSSSFRVAWTPLRFAEARLGISCNVTLEGTFHSTTIIKTEGALIGAITRVSIGHESCTEPIGFFAANSWAYNGEVALGVTLRNELPWHLTYKGFSGILPEIRKIFLLLHGLGFAVQIAAKGCLGTYGGPEENVIGEANLGASGEITSLTPEANAGLRLKEGSGCPETGFFSGNGSVTQAGRSTAITIRLI